jgi:hypothetical protein
MKRSRALLIVSASLFAVWIGYLAWLVHETSSPTVLAYGTSSPNVLARPQFLVADLYVIADIPAHPARPDKPGNPVTIKRVVWSKNPDDGKLASCFVLWPPPRRATLLYWSEPGEYILALSRTEDAGVFQVTPLPRTPGFSGAMGRIYPATHQTLAQLEHLTKEFHP